MSVVINLKIKAWIYLTVVKLVFKIQEQTLPFFYYAVINCFEGAGKKDRLHVSLFPGISLIPFFQLWIAH